MSHINNLKSGLSLTLTSLIGLTVQATQQAVHHSAKALNQLDNKLNQPKENTNQTTK